MGLLSQDQLDVALHEQRRGERMLGEVLVDFGFLTQSALSAVLADSAGLDQFDPSSAMFDPDLINQVPKEIAQRHMVLPVTLEGDVLHVAMADDGILKVLEGQTSIAEMVKHINMTDRML